MNNLLNKKKNQLAKKKKKGFTLVELIIVIAIIAILAAIAIPKFGEIRASANTKADIATAKNIATVVASKIANNETISSGDASTLSLGIDGGIAAKATGHSKFYVEITADKNIIIHYDSSTGDKIYPAS